MFMSCSMVKLVRTAQKSWSKRSILNIGNNRNKINFLEFTNQFMVNQVNRIFSMIEQNDTFRIEATNLMADFWSNWTLRHLSPRLFCQWFRTQTWFIKLNLTSQQVRDINSFWKPPVWGWIPCTTDSIIGILKHFTPIFVTHLQNCSYSDGSRDGIATITFFQLVTFRLILAGHHKNSNWFCQAWPFFFRHIQNPDYLRSLVGCW